MLRALSILDFEPFQLFYGGGRESDLSKLLLTLSIHLHSCKGWPTPSTLSSCPSRRAVEPERTRISYIAVPPTATYVAF